MLRKSEAGIKSFFATVSGLIPTLSKLFTRGDVKY